MSQLGVFNLLYLSRDAKEKKANRPAAHLCGTGSEQIVPHLRNQFLRPDSF